MDNSDQYKVLDDLATLVCDELGSAVTGADIQFGELNLQAGRQDIVDVVRYLRDSPHTGFISFTDLCGVDYPERDERFDVVYHLMNPRNNIRIRVKIKTDEEKPTPSIVSIYPGAEWFEREAYDMYGILFSGHPDLRRLLTDYGFDGYPLRKDFPLTGYVETRYDEELKRVVYEPVELRQEFRDFDFLSPWEGQERPDSGHGKNKHE